MFRAGDAVLHKPSGETWCVAYVEDGRLCACGWPLSLADVNDCELVRAADDAKHEKLLRDMAEMSDRNDPRRRRARSALALSLDE